MGTRFDMMSFKYQMVFVLIICLSRRVVLSGGEVNLVNRNVTDSFRVGENGCMNDTSVCTNHSATCQPSSGLCLCSSDFPDFRNPTIISGGLLKYGESYGCVHKGSIRHGVNTALCPFSPFQVIPYSKNDPVTHFDHKPSVPGVQNCFLRQARAKFPDNDTEIELQWLNESYVDLTILNNTMHFKWRRSVSELQGIIITFNLRCLLSTGPSYSNKCLRAKILGTWPAEAGSVLKTEPTLTSSENTSSQKTTTTESTTVTTSISNVSESTAGAKSNDNDSDSSSIAHKVLYAVLGVSFAVNLALGFVVGYQWKKLKRIQDKNMNITEMQSIDNQRGSNTTDNVSPYDEVVVKCGIRNVGADDHKLSSSFAHSSNERFLDGYEDPSNYQPLRRNQSQDDEHNYQSLRKSQERK